ncbi:hypothetical protein [Pseudomonas quasicaspiana]|uniref:hypothetical protein n=1 Tax=Pseudomonas quasicaspiana TaxID=2829821 RepID=UPI001E4AAB3A|nr:hypothetical protein [Pseudomonas quasicaspiana]MCD5977289.1 hypothetical protein [Pseudomonas quasicaspiana]
MDTTSQNPAGSTDQNNDPPQDHLHNLQEDALAAVASAKEHGSAQFEQYRDTAVDQIESLAHSAQSAAEQMQDGDTLGLSHYVTDLAQNMTTLAGNLRGKSIDELLQQAGKLARDNPALFVTGSVALGFGLSRFLKASNSGQPQGEIKTSSPVQPPTGSTGTQPVRPDDELGSNYQSESSLIVEADHVPPVKHAHMGDVYHSGRPGIVDRSTTPDAAAGSSVPGVPDGSLFDDDLPADAQTREGQSRGDVS